MKAKYLISTMAENSKQFGTQATDLSSTSSQEVKDFKIEVSELTSFVSQVLLPNAQPKEPIVEMNFAKTQQGRRQY